MFIPLNVFLPFYSNIKYYLGGTYITQGTPLMLKVQSFVEVMNCAN